MQNPLRKIASALAALTSAVHIVVGGSDALAPTLAADLPAAASGAMHACWHIVSVLLLASILVFWRGGQVALVFATLWILFAVVFIYVGLYQDGLGGLVTNPQWTILGATGAIAFRTESPPTVAR